MPVWWPDSRPFPGTHSKFSPEVQGVGPNRTALPLRTMEGTEVQASQGLSVRGVLVQVLVIYVQRLSLATGALRSLWFWEQPLRMC